MAGKRRVRWNAVRHGPGIKDPVIPGVERQADWEAHRAALLADYVPKRYRDIQLVELLAYLWWRLRRIRGAETAYLAALQEGSTASWPIGHRPRSSGLPCFRLVNRSARWPRRWWWRSECGKGWRRCRTWATTTGFRPRRAAKPCRR